MRWLAPLMRFQGHGRAVYSSPVEVWSAPEGLTQRRPRRSISLDRHRWVAEAVGTFSFLVIGAELVITCKRTFVQPVANVRF